VRVAEEQLRTFVIQRGNMSVVLLSWEEEFRESEIDYLQEFMFWIDQDVKWLDISVHDSHRMNVVQTLG
jgi:hypothetical protein